MKPQKAAHGVSRGRELGLGQARREAKEIEQTNLSSPVPPIAMDFAISFASLRAWPSPSSLPRLTPWAAFCGFIVCRSVVFPDMANLGHASDYGRRLRIDNFF